MCYLRHLMIGYRAKIKYMYVLPYRIGIMSEFSHTNSPSYRDTRRRRVWVGSLGTGGGGGRGIHVLPN